MLFNDRVVLLARDRQSRTDGWGSWCAMCGKGLWRVRTMAVPRVPISQGGNKKTANCIVMCNECFANIKNPGKEEIPWEMIPYYDTAPRNWAEQCRQSR